MPLTATSNGGGLKNDPFFGDLLGGTVDRLNKFAMLAGVVVSLSMQDPREPVEYGKKTVPRAEMWADLALGFHSEAAELGGIAGELGQQLGADGTSADAIQHRIRAAVGALYRFVVGAQVRPTATDVDRALLRSDLERHIEAIHQVGEVLSGIRAARGLVPKSPHVLDLPDAETPIEGYVNISQIRVQWPLSKAELERVRKRLEHWRRTHEDEVAADRSTPERPHYAYPVPIVRKIVEQVLAKTRRGISPSTSPPNSL